MPNQPVTVVYTYEIDPSYVTHVTINRIDNHNNVLAEPETREVSPNETVTVNVERKAGYTYPPNIGWNGTFTDISMDQTAATLSFKTDFTGGTVTITYNEDLNDTAHWARINYYNSEHGSLSGDSSPRSLRLGTHSIDTITEGITPSPEQHYMFNGWYKANASGTGKVGTVLTGDIELTGDLKLYADFVEDPGQWCDIRLKAEAAALFQEPIPCMCRKGLSGLRFPCPRPHRTVTICLLAGLMKTGIRLQTRI